MIKQVLTLKSNAMKQMQNMIKGGFLQIITVLVIVLLFIPAIKADLVNVDSAAERMVAVGIVLLSTSLITASARNYYIKWWSRHQKNTHI